MRVYTTKAPDAIVDEFIGNLRVRLVEVREAN